MEFNLKKLSECKNMSCVVDWKRRFEKELREILKKYEDGGSLPYFVSDFIKDILGDSEASSS